VGGVGSLVGWLFSYLVSHSDRLSVCLSAIYSLHYLITAERNNKNVIYGAEHEKGRNKKEITAKGTRDGKKVENILKYVLMMILLQTGDITGRRR